MASENELKECLEVAVELARSAGKVLALLLCRSNLLSDFRLLVMLFMNGKLLPLKIQV